MKGGNTDAVTPPSAKKLKQATLNFFTAAKNERKRKKSESDNDDIKVLKVRCNEQNNSASKEVVCVVDLDDVNKNNSKENAATAKSEIEAIETVDDGKKVLDCKVVKVETSNVTRVEVKCDETPGEVKSDETDVDVKNDETDVDVKSKNVLPKTEPLQETPVKTSGESEVVSSPLASCSSKSDEDSNTEVSSANVSLNVSALIGNDGNDSLVSLSDIPLTPLKTPSSANKKPRKLSQKQLLRQEESQRRKEEKEKEKEREKEEREKKRQEEKENRRRQREEKEEQRRLEKQEKLQKKQAEIDQKNEEKRRKEEERLLEKKRKEEEKLKAEEDKKRADEEALKKKEKAAAAFASFFTPKRNNNEPKEVAQEPVSEVVKQQNFMPFCLKVDMRLAPTARRTLDSEQRKLLDTCLLSQKSSQLYMKQLKESQIKPGKSGRTWSTSEAKNDVMIIESTNRDASNPYKKLRAKLLFFHENRRPAYWGTWRKKSSFVKPRKPFAMDTVCFDYEVDSDDEWEEEEPGELLQGSDSEEKESDDDYELDNSMFVPHGYLSDDEAGEEAQVIPHELRKARMEQQHLQYMEGLKKKSKIEKLTPKVIGIFWEDPAKEGQPGYDELKSFMQAWQIIKPAWTEPTKTMYSHPDAPDFGAKSQVKKVQVEKLEGSSKRGAKPKPLPEESIPYLIRLMHGNTKSSKFLAREFITFWEKHCKGDAKVDPAKSTEDGGELGGSNGGYISQGTTLKAIKELAQYIPCPEEGPMHLKPCWFVPAETRETHGLKDLKLPNEWAYILTETKRGRPKETTPKETKPKEENTESDTAQKQLTPKASLITKFTKKLSSEEREKQIKRKSLLANSANKLKVKSSLSTSSSPTTSSPAVKTPSSADAKSAGIKAFCVSKAAPTTPTSTPDSAFKVPHPVSSTPPLSNEKKGRRVSILVSVPRGQEIPSSQGDKSPFSNEASPVVARAFNEASPVVARAFQFSKAASSTEDNNAEGCKMLE